MAFAQKLWNADCIGFNEKFLSVDEVMKQSGLDFEVRAEDVFLEDGTKVPKCRATRRMDTKEILGTVGQNYKVLQNAESFAFFQPFIDTSKAYIDNVGTLKKGALTFIQAKVCIDPVEITNGDAVESYINIINSHTGITSVLCGYFPRRIFCQNQLPALKASKMLKVKHTKNVNISLQKIQEIMDVSNQEFLATCETYKFLASRGVNKKTLEKYVKLVFAKKNEEVEDTEETENSRILEKIEYLFENGRGAKESPNTVYKLFNAVNEYLNYDAGRTPDSILYSLWNGVNYQLNQKALDVAVQIANGK
jgi:phage/plasmid-like protein (TIGR03299 family)